MTPIPRSGATACTWLAALLLAVSPALAAPQRIALAAWESSSAPAYLGAMSSALRTSLEGDTAFALLPSDSADLMARRGDWPSGSLDEASARRIADLCGCGLLVWGRMELAPSSLVRKWWPPLWGERRETATATVFAWDAAAGTRRILNFEAVDRLRIGYIGFASTAGYPQDEVARARAGERLARDLARQVAAGLRGFAASGAAAAKDDAAPSGRTDAPVAPKP